MMPADMGSFGFADVSLRAPFAKLRMTTKKTGSRGSPSEANRGDVHLDRRLTLGKSCLGVGKNWR